MPCSPSEVLADAGYLSSTNVQHIVGKGATPYIRPRKNTVGRPPPKKKDSPHTRTGEAFRDMVHAYKTDESNWLSRYGHRNSIESAWSGVKRKFTGAVMAATTRMRRVEAALKLVAWNLTRMARWG